jgi:cytochrome c5
MKKLLVLTFICAAGVVSCGKKIVPESDANNPSEPTNNKSSRSATQSANTTTSTNTTPSFNNMKNSLPPVQNPTTAVSLEKGKAVFLSKCGTCHALKKISDYSPSRWNDFLKTEIPRAKLSSEEGNQVTDFILAKANR